MTIKTLELLELAHRISGSRDIQELFEISDKILEFDKRISVPRVEVKANKKATGGQIICKNIIEFALTCKINHPIKKALDFQPYTFQEEYLKFLNDGKRYKIVNKPRQMGFSFLMSVHAIWSAISKADQTIVILSPKFATSLNIFERIRFLIENTNAVLPDITEYNRGAITFSNGSRIVARAISDNSIRGLSPSWLLIDDAAYASYKNLQDLWNTIDFSETSTTKVLMQSNPKWTEGLFYRLWCQAEGAGFDAKKWIWSDHPERDVEWYQHTQKIIGPTSFAMEYEGEFVENPTDKGGINPQKI